jgi:hypothetical protein
MSQLVHIANYFEADRISATAGSAMVAGDVVALEANADGSRRVTLVDAALDLRTAGYGVVMKVSTDPLATASSTAAAKTGNRVSSIASNDDVVLVGAGAYIEYDVSLLDASLDPARSGVLPTTGALLGIRNAKFSTLAAAGAITDPVVARVVEVFGGNKVRIKLHDPQANA